MLTLALAGSWCLYEVVERPLSSILGSPGRLRRLLRRQGEPHVGADIREQPEVEATVRSTSIE